MLFCKSAPSPHLVQSHLTRALSMLLADWAFMSTWLWIHILAVPTIQHALGLKSLYAVFGLHWFSQIMFHRNLNKSVSFSKHRRATRAR